MWGSAEQASTKSNRVSELRAVISGYSASERPWRDKEEKAMDQRKHSHVTLSGSSFQHEVLAQRLTNLVQAA